MDETRTFILMIGPQAVGKMAVGKQLALDLGYQFSHNHHSIELALQFYPYGSEGFSHISGNLRTLIFENIRKYDNKGFIFTYMMAFGNSDEISYILSICEPFRKEGWKVLFVELEANLSTRLERNRHPDRLDAKASKRNTQLSDDRLIASLEKYELNASKEFPFPIKELHGNAEHYLKINNESLNIPKQVEKICYYFNLR